MTARAPGSFSPMSMAAHERLLHFVLTKSEDPEIQARQKLIARVYIEMTPEVIAEARKEALDQSIEEGRIIGARSALRRVLARRKLPLHADEEARIDACTDLARLRSWVEQAVDAPSAAAALK